MSAASATVRPALRTRPRRPRPPRVLFHAAATLVGVLFLAPIAVVVLASFRTQAESGRAALPPWPVEGATFDSYVRLDGLGGSIWTYAGNSVYVAIGTTLLTVVVSTLAGYGFSRHRFPGKPFVFLLVLITIMIPFQSILTPLFLLLAKLGLQNTLTGLVFVYTTLQLPFSVFMMRNAFDAVPREIEEAARIDGVRDLGMLFRVTGPLVVPGIVTVALFAFLNSWNEFLAALVLLTDQDKYTLPILMVSARIGRMGTIDWGAMQAGITVMMIPCLLLFLALQRHYIRGLTAGAVK